MLSLYKDVLDGFDSTVKGMVIAFDDDVPVGICIIYRYSYERNFNISIYVKKSYRLLCIGSRMTKHALKIFPKGRIHSFSWKPSQRKFFESTIPSNRIKNFYYK